MRSATTECAPVGKAANPARPATEAKPPGPPRGQAGTPAGSERLLRTVEVSGAEPGRSVRSRPRHRGRTGGGRGSEPGSRADRSERAPATAQRPRSTIATSSPSRRSRRTPTAASVTLPHAYPRRNHNVANAGRVPPPPGPPHPPPGPPPGPGGGPPPPGGPPAPQPPPPPPHTPRPPPPPAPPPAPHPQGRGSSRARPERRRHHRRQLPGRQGQHGHVHRLGPDPRCFAGPARAGRARRHPWVAH